MSQINHTLAHQEKALQLNIPLLLTGVHAERDGCVLRLEERLGDQTGIHQVHLDRDEAGRSVLCLHYGPNLVPLG